MKVLVFLVCFCSIFVSQPLLAFTSITTGEKPSLSERFVIKRVKKDDVKGTGYTPEGMLSQIKVLEMETQYIGPQSVQGKSYLKAYFYDSDFRQIGGAVKPIDLWYQDEAIPAPESWGEDEYTVYIPVLPSLEKARWKKAVIVFGNEEEVNARVYPSGDLIDFSFDEKHMVFDSVQAKTQVKKNKKSLPTRYEVRAVRDKMQAPYVENKDLRGRAEGVKVILRVHESLPPPKYLLKAYYYDKSNRLIHTQGHPVAILRGEGRTSAWPVILELDESYEAFFPFDPVVEALPWRKIVIVFGDEKSVAADLLGSSADELVRLNFPEKVRWLPWKEE